MYRALPFFMCFVVASGFLPSAPLQGKLPPSLPSIAPTRSFVLPSCPRTCPLAPLASRALASVISRKLQGRDGPTVWSEFGALASQRKCVNLGQGFPDWSPPSFVRDAAVEAIMKGTNQYTRTAGHLPLARTLAARYRMHLEREVRAETEVAVTVGASQALYVSLQSLLEQGDEVLLMEPFFDLYMGQILLAGGKPVFVPLEPTEEGEWKIDMKKVEEKVSKKTRIIVLNSPHNPTGKVFSLAEMEALAEIVRKHERIVVISDEVYKDTLGSAGHVHFARLPGMWDRTLTISSAGKTFSVTGWQVGWIIGPSRYLRDIQVLLPFIQFCAATPMQDALVQVLKQADQPYEGERNYYDWLKQQYTMKKEKLEAALRAANIIPMKGQGGFFLIGDTRNVKVPQTMTRDWALCRWLAKEHGIISIPCSPFYSPENRHLASNFVRFAFCKTDETLQEALEAFRVIGQAEQSK
ncbi:hypothetical protein GUITHDRAFT_159025 [Guillardia theta CCMP2712]|uniref:Aminotransferase class I/classII large domain-containing protein n=1 Tax=Guillardia theta (strain CCMP2712) TaxID=905079 RepID=L1I7C4_GUITC|nr:hypothetical protein GUITHDRAFT_159025 [Guillardia theta CCMP2712]EKX31760.1 hypothetical protein GUITHDRAFT_159025 [Guillardia theta CCMP2712]|eukprot:XP_005818740.1 hypothetical protein GUITHDRAFT_159025 [Guillardia theta CCMP2712]